MQTREGEGGIPELLEALKDPMCYPEYFKTRLPVVVAETIFNFTEESKSLRAKNAELQAEVAGWKTGHGEIAEHEKLAIRRADAAESALSAALTVIRALGVQVYHGELEALHNYIADESAIAAFREIEGKLGK